MRTGERLLVVALCAAIGWFHLWTVRSSGDPWKFGLEQRDYYNLLIDGWLEGQLHLKVDVPEALLRLSDPYDPAVRPVGLGLHDATFFRGKYYLYFGAAPVVVLMLPFRLWTGIDLPLPVATLVFVYAAFLASTGLFLAVRRRYFPAVGTPLTLLGVAVLGLAALGPVLLRRPHMWELPIGAGYCFAMLTLLCVWRSLHGRRLPVAPWRSERVVWMAGAGLCLGLAIASRPPYLIASPLLGVPLLLWTWRERRRARGRKGAGAGPLLPWREGVAVVAPLAVVGAAMAWHNQARFGDPLQFGQAYQFSLDYESKMAHFRASHVPFNVWRYFFSAADWSRYFPFIAPAPLPPKPPGFGGHDDVYGLLRNLPIAWLALAAPLALWRRRRSERAALGAWLSATAVLFATMAGTLLLFFGSLARYQSDFAPAIMLLAVVGMLALDRALHERGHRRAGTAVRGLAAVLALSSAGFAVLFSLQLDGLLRERNPEKFLEVARAWNRLPAALERLVGARCGPVELDLRLASAPPVTRVLLLTAGEAPGPDRVWVRYEAEGRVRFEIESAHGVRQETPPVRFDPNATHRLRVMMGSLLPPEAHPDFAGVTRSELAALTRRLRVSWDDSLLLDLAPWFAGGPGPVEIGSAAADAGAPAARVLDWRRDEEALRRERPEWRARAAEAGRRLTPRGALAIELELPSGRAGAREPLVVAGRPGRADLVVIEYLEGGAVRFLFDHWGGALLSSEPWAIGAGRRVEVTVTMESLRQPLPFLPVRTLAHGQLEISVDGRSGWRVPAEFYAVDPVEIAVGRNPVGGTSCGPVFTGTLHRVTPVGARR